MRRILGTSTTCLRAALRWVRVLFRPFEFGQSESEGPDGSPRRFIVCDLNYGTFRSTGLDLRDRLLCRSRVNRVGMVISIARGSQPVRLGRVQYL